MTARLDHGIHPGLLRRSVMRDADDVPNSQPLGESRRGNELVLVIAQVLRLHLFEGNWWPPALDRQPDMDLIRTLHKPATLTRRVGHVQDHHGCGPSLLVLLHWRHNAWPF